MNRIPRRKGMCHTGCRVCRETRLRRVLKAAKAKRT